MIFDVQCIIYSHKILGISLLFLCFGTELNSLYSNNVILVYYHSLCLCQFQFIHNPDFPPKGHLLLCTHEDVLGAKSRS